VCKILGTYNLREDLVIFLDEDLLKIDVSLGLAPIPSCSYSILYNKN